MRRVARWLAALAGVLCVAFGARVLWIAAFPPAAGSGGDGRTLAQLQFLSRDPVTLERHADAMQALFPEGRLFTVALSGLAWANVRDHTAAATRAEADRHVLDAVRLAEAEETRRTFGPAGGLPHGVFYDAWTTHLLLAAPAGIGEIQDSLAVRCRRLGAALEGDALWIDSYPGQAWPADAVVGAAALHDCGRLNPGHAETSRQWLRRVRRHLDPETGLIPHAAGSPMARGSSSALMVPFLSQIDPRFARDQHRQWRRHFGTHLLAAFPAVREYRHGTEGRGDVDSGPVVLGVSAPASVVGVAAARAAGNGRQAQALRATVELFGLPVQRGGARRYAFGQLPVGDAFLAWASSVPTAPAREPPPDWRWRWAALGLMAVGVGAVALGYGVGRGGSSRARASISGQPSR